MLVKSEVKLNKAGSTYVFGSKVGLEEVPSVGHVGSVNGCKRVKKQ
jgi:hypothetical protein